ncbi:hypothetical protein KY290_013480 [Solanum tuberosum]|uniref:Uncharacterized protein n=1 Tax=Solanum tuberosum TaxID=4113 RepID=A0ABQ7VP20_SOLTU|nr:hypothetical protein KY290_013480 [Solanum tuberosum]
MEDRVLEERSEKNPVANAFAVCIGGILSIVSQEFQLSCIATSPVVQHVSISSDRYVNEISEHQEQAIITIGDMYAHEKKELLVYLPIPSVKTTQVVETSLLKTRVRQLRHVGLFPLVLSPTDVIVSLEVDRQINWIEVTEAIQET